MSEKSCLRCGKSLGPNAHGNRKWCSENCRKRAWERKWLRSDASRHVCPDCGERLTAGSARPVLVKRHEDARGTPHQGCPGCARKQREQIVEWWAAGMSSRELCDRLGWTKGTLSGQLDRMRRLGYDLPYRYRLSRPRHDKQVAA